MSNRVIRKLHNTAGAKEILTHHTDCCDRLVRVLTCRFWNYILKQEGLSKQSLCFLFNRTDNSVNLASYAAADEQKQQF